MAAHLLNFVACTKRCVCAAIHVHLRQREECMSEVCGGVYACVLQVVLFGCHDGILHLGDACPYCTCSECP